LELAELVAKVTYNAVDPSDPFDHDAGWMIPASLRWFVDTWQDEKFSQAAWSALCFPKQVDNRPSGTNMPGKAREHLELAARYWREGQPLEAGRLIFECLPTEVRPTWAVGILTRVLDRGRVDLREALDEVQDVYSTFGRVLEDAKHPRLWADARRAYDYLGGDSESGEEQEPPGLTDAQKTLFRTCSLAQLVAKVTYNASDPPDPFDENSGWRIAESLRGFVDLWQDEEFSQAAWSALCFPFRPV
jgi:hypothetical protein